MVHDNFPVPAPGAENGFRCADSRSSRVSARSEPVVLRRTGGAGAHATIAGTIDGRSKDTVLKSDIGTDDGCREVV